ncbi:Hfq-related RNA-binding protein [Gloeobacter violaceus]|uniref:Gsr3030 protein n=1 Tax=Gloeobacter violaceus (strain ATCC 29082 / PCC 7421) TaxID=251221 RepID=Q7NCE9_GLOVI|nr:hypothetical protein [Gloeobacter violaceus]BAC90971.1 gsr3030 [Gloeobacter violaceus PCC 7421]
MSTLDLAVPSTRYLQKLIRDQSPVSIATRAGDAFNGVLRWQDGECLCLKTAEGEILLWRSGLTFIRPLPPGPNR